MTSPAVSFGIVAIDHVLGEARSVDEAAARYTRDVERIREWGYRAFHRADDEAGLTDLATAAGSAALQRAGVAAGDVDLLVLAIPDIAEYLYWDAAAACQARLGVHRAEAALLNQACSGGVLAFDFVAGKFGTHPEYQVALIVAANRVCEDYRNRMDSDTSVASDGAAAAVAVRDHDKCRWLVTEVMSDGRYADFCRLPRGGSARPFSAACPDSGALTSPFDRMQEHFGTDVRTMLEFARRIRSNNREVVERACARAGTTIDEIRRVLHVNDNRRALTTLAADLGVRLEDTNLEVAMAHGHFGTADQIFGLGKLLDEGSLEADDLVALTSTGTGMHWGCTLLRI
jgi:3-oxoacyl-[acyl-carrier-protein] synthase III